MLGLLVEIRDQLIELNAAATPEPETDGCTHEHKVSFATPGNPHHWICPECGVGTVTN